MPIDRNAIEALAYVVRLASADDVLFVAGGCLRHLASVPMSAAQADEIASKFEAVAESFRRGIANGEFRGEGS